jgi:hypothetical protein
VRYSERTDEGPIDFVPLCPHCGEVVFGDVGCTTCMQIPRCDHDWYGCGPAGAARQIWHQCRLREGHEGTHVCEWCYGSAPAEEVPA